MAEESRRYDNVDRAQFDQLRDRIRPYVELPEGDSGKIQSQGMTGRYAYDAQARTLELTLEDVPFFIPRGMVWSTIERALER
ncbi:MAG TPA: hypothetical protein VFE17_13420 [Candidatus Baltobacteraceae bacterium]|jgi:hypothetical protein|nr:hypothetical protein [Candidatus Baltobacteraceae bacterium]